MSPRATMPDDLLVVDDRDVGDVVLVHHRRDIVDVRVRTDVLEALLHHVGDGGRSRLLQLLVVAPQGARQGELDAGQDRDRGRQVQARLGDQQVLVAEQPDDLAVGVDDRGGADPLLREQIGGLRQRRVGRQRDDVLRHHVGHGGAARHQASRSKCGRCRRWRAVRPLIVPLRGQRGRDRRDQVARDHPSMPGPVRGPAMHPRPGGRGLEGPRAPGQEGPDDAARARRRSRRSPARARRWC